jgi:hypothetical protein
MGTNPQRVGRQRELREQGVPLDTLINNSSFRLLLTHDTLVKVADAVSRRTTRRPLAAAQIDQLRKFITQYPPGNLFDRSYHDAILHLANEYVNRGYAARIGIREEDDDAKISGVAGETDVATIAEYNKKEVMQFTPNENQLKFSTYADRRGNAVIDRARVAGERSSPDNILPAGQAGQIAVNRELYKAMKLLQNFLEPQSVETMFATVQTATTTYQSINLPEQIIQLDTRNRDPTSAINQFKWIVHNAGQVGSLGSIKLQDTVQQSIRMSVTPFWAPINASIVGPYDTIRMLVIEFGDQSIAVPQFNDPTQSKPIETPYHFEFNIAQTQGDRVYLVPKQPYFHFRRPVARVESLTLMFYTPYNIEIFDPDSGYYTITFGNPTIFTGSVANTLNTGDLVYVYNASSGNTTIDAEINQSQGWPVTRLSATQFSIAVDSSAVIGTDTNVLVYYGSKRMSIQLGLLSLEQ